MVGRVAAVVVVVVVVGFACSIANARVRIIQLPTSSNTDSGDSSGVYVTSNTCLGPTPTLKRSGQATGGTITAPTSDSIHRCHWAIVNPKRKNIVISFPKFDLTAGLCSDASTCCHQWLTLSTDDLYHSRENTYYHPYSHTTSPGEDIFGAGVVCGSDLPRPVMTQASRVFVDYYYHVQYVFEFILPDGHTEAVHQNVSSSFILDFYTVSNGSVCEEDEFHCLPANVCMPLAWLCDGKVHCPDRSDETSCAVGRSTKRQLKEGQEVVDDVKNKTVACGSGHEGSTGIPCDGHWQCADGSDEKGCAGCGADEWWCGIGQQCYSAKERCDGTPHCVNAMDELSCNPRCPARVSCWGGGCYLLSQRCDGAHDCGDGSDEANCTPELCNAQHGTFLCQNRRCIRETWLCDQLDDCTDGSDEEGCLRNSVIGVAAMGGLACSLLLVVAVGCTGRLYALRMGLTQLRSSVRAREGRGTPGSSNTPRSRLEEHLMQREMPPPYDVAVSEHSTPLFGTCLDWQHWRRQRQRLGGPGESARVPLDPHDPRFHLPPILSTPGLVEIQPGRREEVEKVEESGGNSGENDSDSAFLLPHTLEGDVPLLSVLVGDEGEGERDDVPLLLDIASTTTSSSSSSSASGGDSDQDEVGSEVGSDGGEEEDGEEGEEGGDKPTTLPLLPDLLHLTPHLPITPRENIREGMGKDASPTTFPNREGVGVDMSSPTSSSFPIEIGGEVRITEEAE